MKYPEVQNYLDGSFVGGHRPFIDVYNPSDGTVISRVPLSSRDDVDAAVASARARLPGMVAHADQGARSGLLSATRRCSSRTSTSSLRWSPKRTAKSPARRAPRSSSRPS